MDLELVSVDDDDSYLITAFPAVIGRDGGNDITIARDLLSRRHAKLSLIDDEWILEDLKSTNGTSVNNRQITRPTKVKVGDVIKFGETAYYLKSTADGGRTIVASRLPKKESSVGGSVMIDDEPDGDLTSFHQSYQLPPGWTNVSKPSTTYSKEVVDQVIHGHWCMVFLLKRTKLFGPLAGDLMSRFGWITQVFRCNTLS